MYDSMRFQEKREILKKERSEYLSAHHLESFFFFAFNSGSAFPGTYG